VSFKKKEGKTELKCSESVGFRTLSIVKDTTFLTLDLFASSLERRSPLERVLPFPEDGNISSLQNVVFSSYSEFLTMGRVHKSRDSECYTLSSEPLSIETAVCDPR
jgi:hypothetical protein